MSIGPHHTIIFDTIKTDTHGNYNNYTGAFSIPVGGVYVFTWSIRGDGAQSFELVKNADVLDALYFTGNNIQLENRLSENLMKMMLSLLEHMTRTPEVGIYSATRMGIPHFLGIE